MPLSLPGALAAVVADMVTGAVTVTTAAGETLPAGTVTPGTRAWLDEWGRVILEAPNGEQTRVGNVAGAPADPVYRGGGVVNNTPGTNPAGPAVVLTLGRRWSATITTDATGAATVQLPAGLFSALWSVHANPVTPAGGGGGAFCGVNTATTSAIALQVWAGTGVLLGGATLAKPSTAVPVYLEVSGAAPS